MQDPNWQRIKQLFTAAAALPPDQHTAFLAANEPDAAIRAEVLSLLAAHSPTVAPGANTDGPRVEGPGSRIGPYKLLEVIGEGGFGVVYAAEQESPVRRRVALKIVKAGMDSRQVIARFEQERQALALMDHPNIARVFDGGATPSGRPFFVMELVKGDPITEYCDREKLTTAERLRLFVDVGRAVQHAHTKGVIHRDLKPSNVLVTLVDGKAIAKVIDFGVAKATQGRLTDKTLFTEHKQMIGTPLYMSPEQAHISGVDVDTRSDVYSLGVMLYELLTGTTPFRKEELLEAGLVEMHRVLKEVEPQKPSTRVATLGKTRGAVAAQRRVEVAKWNAMLRGDLDWIVMKCLEKERARRYETASDLVRDVERHLAGEAVLAAPPSVGYRVLKFARRRKMQVAAGAALALVALAGGGTTLWQLRERVSDAELASARQEILTEAREFHSYASHIQAANAARLQNDSAAMQRHLEACPERLRNFEWRHLASLADSSIFQTERRPNNDLDREVALHRDWSNEVAGLWDRDSRTGVPAAESLRTGYELCATLIPGGCRIATHRVEDGRHRIDVRDVTTGGTRLLQSLPWPSNPTAGEGDVLRACFGPGGSSLVAHLCRSADDDNQGRVVAWNPESAQLTTLPENPVSITFSDRGDLAAVGCFDGTASIYSLPDWIRRFDISGRIASTMRFGHGNHLLATTHDDGSCRLLDADSGTSLQTFEPTGSNDAFDACCSPDGGTLAIGYSDGTVGLWDVRKNSWKGRLVGHTAAVLGLDWSPDGTFLATASRDRTVRVWEAGTFKLRSTLLGHRAAAVDPRFSDDGDYLVSASQDHRRRIWSAASWQPSAGSIVIRSLQDHLTIADGDNLASYRVWFSDDSRELRAPRFSFDLASGGVTYRATDDLLLRSADAARARFDDRPRMTGNIATPTNGVARRITASGNAELEVYVYVDGQYGGSFSFQCASGAEGGIVVIDPVLGLERTLDNLPSALSDLPCVSRDGSVAALLRDNTVALYEPESTRPYVTSVRDASSPTVKELQIDCVSLSSDGGMLACFSDEPRLMRARGRTTIPLALPHSIFEKARAIRPGTDGNDLNYAIPKWSADGSMLSASILNAHILVVWNTSDGSICCTLEEREQAINRSAFAPDGKRIATAAFCGTLRLWEIPSGRECVDLSVSSWEILTLAFTPDGHALIAMDDSERYFAIDTTTPASKDKNLHEQRTAWRTVESAFAATTAGTAWHPDEPRIRSLLDSLPAADRRAAAMTLQARYDTAKASVRATLRQLLDPAVSVDQAEQISLAAEAEARLFQDNPDAAFWLALGRYRAGRFEDALQVLTPFDEDRYDLGNLFAMVHTRLGHREEAARYAAKGAKPLRDEALRVLSTLPETGTTDGR